MKTIQGLKLLVTSDIAGKLWVSLNWSLLGKASCMVRLTLFCNVYFFSLSFHLLISLPIIHCVFPPSFFCTAIPSPSSHLLLMCFHIMFLCMRLVGVCCINRDPIILSVLYRIVQSIHLNMQLLNQFILFLALWHMHTHNYT